MQKLLFVSLLIGFLNVSASAQQTGTLRGTISDSTTGEILAYSNVLIQELEKGASTDAKGFFIITSIPANREYTLIASYVGYKKKELTFKVLPNKITQVDIQLSQASFELQEVEKVGEKVETETTSDIGLERISIRELETLPKGVETDVFRSLKSIAGVRSTGDVSARYYVRGGSSNQNLVLFEGVPVYNPFHALGMFSAVDPDIINNIEFYKGGFTAEYSGRLSSILSLITKDGNKFNYGGQASISQLSAKALVEGPIPHGSFIVTARKSYSTEIYRKFLNDQNAPVEFYDASFKLNYSNPDILPISKFSLYGFFSSDELNDDDPFKEDFSWGNSLIGFNWFQADENSPLFYDLNVSYSTFSGEVLPNLSNAKPRKNELSDITMKLDFIYMFSNNDEMNLGFQITEIKTDLFVTNSFGAESNIGTSGSNISLYGKYVLQQFDNIGIDVGTRANITRLSTGGDVNNIFEPRASLSYKLADGISLKGAWGIYQQELTTLSDESEVISLFSPWLITPDYIDPAVSTHYTIGLEADKIFGHVDFDIEGYYKISKNIPTINDEKFNTTDPDFLPGKEEAYGWEFSLKYTNLPVKLTSSYSLSWAYKEVDNWLYYPKYDTRHTVNLSGEYQFGSGWSASIVWAFHSGLPFTQSIGFYDKLYFSDLSTDNYFIFNSYSPYALLRDRNLGRLPVYHRMDINISKEFDFDFMQASIDFSIINVYDRKNIFYFKRDTGERVNMLPFLPTATLKVKL